jgi:hypothetical protein
MGLFGGGGSLPDRIVHGRTDLVFDFVPAKGAATTVHDGAPLVTWCARFGDVSAVRHLLAHGEQLAALDENLGLDAAAYFGYWRLCEFLIEHGADVNHPDPTTGETPLHAALCTPNRPAFDLVVQVLLAAGADPNLATQPDVETGAFMRDCRTKGETSLHRAAAFGSEETVGRLLAAGARVEAKDMNGETPLGWASWHTRPDAILRKLCYGSFHIRADRGSLFDHGMGWGFMERDLLGTPRSK